MFAILLIFGGLGFLFFPLIQITVGLVGIGFIFAITAYTRIVNS